MRVLIVEDEPYPAEAVRDGLRPGAITADRIDDKAAGFELGADDTAPGAGREGADRG